MTKEMIKVALPDVPQEKETKKKRELRIQETAEQRIGREKVELIDRILHNKLVDINSKVAFILNHFPNTRNSDIDLAIQYWKNFDRDVIGSDDSVSFSRNLSASLTSCRLHDYF